MSTISDIKSLAVLAALGAGGYAVYKIVKSSPVQQVTESVTEFVNNVSETVEKAPETIQGMNTAAQTATDVYVNEVSTAVDDAVTKVYGKAATAAFGQWLKDIAGQKDPDTETVTYNTESAMKANAAMQTVKAVGDFVGSAASGVGSFFKGILGIKD